MKHLLSAFFILLAFVAYSQAADHTRRPVNLDSLLAAMDGHNTKKIGTPFPAFSIPSSAGDVSNAALKGKVVYFNFWFSACPPCVAEFAMLNELYERLKGNNDFSFISLTFESPGEIERIKTKYHIRYQVFSLSHEECGRLNLENAYPTGIVLDKTGVVKYIHRGGSTNKQQIKKYINKELYPQIAKEL
jgi:peroxiredoxin